MLLKKFLSVCSGIEAASVAWEPLGWEPIGFSEIEAFPSKVLKIRFPNTPNFGDMNHYAKWPIEPGSVDVIIGGTPCQSFSVAGLRKGLSDPRGNLALVYLGLVRCPASVDYLGKCPWCHVIRIRTGLWFPHWSTG